MPTNEHLQPFWVCKQSRRTMQWSGFTDCRRRLGRLSRPQGAWACAVRAHAQQEDCNMWSQIWRFKDAFGSGVWTQEASSIAVHASTWCLWRSARKNWATETPTSHKNCTKTQIFTRGLSISSGLKCTDFLSDSSLAFRCTRSIAYKRMMWKQWWCENQLQALLNPFKYL